MIGSCKKNKTCYACHITGSYGFSNLNPPIIQADTIVCDNINDFIAANNYDHSSGWSGACGCYKVDYIRCTCAQE